MAHNLYSVDGKYQRFLATSNGVKPIWEGLGTIVDKAQTWSEAARLAGLDFELKDAELNTIFEIVTTHKAIVRSDTGATVGIVGRDFGTVQPAEAFGFLDCLKETGEAHYISAGLLGETGGKMWILMAVPGASFEVTEGDKNDTYLLFAQGFDGTMSLMSKLTTTRVECNNTLSVALSDSNFTLKLRHSKNIGERLLDARKLLSGVTQNAHTLESKLRKLAGRKLKREGYMAIMDKIFPKKEDVKQGRREGILEEITNLYMSNDRNAFPEQKGTAYNLLNAITNYADHQRASRANGHTADHNRAESALFGSGDALKSKAMEVIYQMTDGTEEVRTVVAGASFAEDAPRFGGLLDDILNS